MSANLQQNRGITCQTYLWSDRGKDEFVVNEQQENDRRYEPLGQSHPIKFLNKTGGKLVDGEVKRKEISSKSKSQITRQKVQK